jgi:serine/threonine protein kinase
MAPEYMWKRQISNKNDIFSLGIIIIQIMAGAKGYDKCGEMPSPQQFMELVRNGCFS